MASVRNILAINDPDPKEMTIVEHLEELRHRLIVCISVITLGSVVGWFFKTAVFDLLSAPLTPYLNSKHKASHPLVSGFILPKLTDAFVLELKISIAIGIALTLPVLLYQLWMFIAPAVSMQARRYAVPFVLVGILLFVIGGGVGYLVFPRVVQFLVGQANGLGNSVTFLLTVGDYVTQFALVLIIFGTVFELPVVLTFLAMIGVVSSRFLRSKRKYAGMIGLILAMIITPGADPITPFITAAVVYLLYEISIVSVRMIHR